MAMNCGVNPTNIVGHSVNWVLQKIYGVECVNEISEGYAIAFTFGLGIFLGLISFFIKRRQDRTDFRRENTTRYIYEFANDFKKSLKHIGPYAFGGEVLHFTWEDFKKHHKSWNEVLDYLVSVQEVWLSEGSKSDSSYFAINMENRDGLDTLHPREP